MDWISLGEQAGKDSHVEIRECGEIKKKKYSRRKKAFVKKKKKICLSVFEYPGAQKSVFGFFKQKQGTCQGAVLKRIKKNS